MFSPSLSSFLTTCPVDVTQAALAFIWFLGYILTGDLCSSHDFLLECLVPWSFHVISCHSSVSFNATSSERPSLSPPATDPSLSHHLLQILCTLLITIGDNFLFTMCLPHCQVSSMGLRTFFCLLRCCIPSD